MGQLDTHIETAATQAFNRILRNGGIQKENFKDTTINAFGLGSIDTPRFELRWGAYGGGAATPIFSKIHFSETTGQRKVTPHHSAQVRDGRGEVQDLHGEKVHLGAQCLAQVEAVDAEPGVPVGQLQGARVQAGPLEILNEVGEEGVGREAARGGASTAQ
jgi:hypothetical protein